jgi:hypothetical protein
MTNYGHWGYGGPELNGFTYNPDHQQVQGRNAQGLDYNVRVRTDTSIFDHPDNPYRTTVINNATTRQQIDRLFTRAQYVVWALGGPNNLWADHRVAHEVRREVHEQMREILDNAWKWTAAQYGVEASKVAVRAAIAVVIACVLFQMIRDVAQGYGILPSSDL